MTVSPAGGSLSAQAIKDFAERYDPQPFHLDEAAAAASPFGGLVASGWHGVALALAMLAERLDGPLRLVAVADVRWLNPLRVGAEATLADVSVVPGPLGVRELRASLAADGAAVTALRCTLGDTDATSQPRRLPRPLATWDGEGETLSAPFAEVCVGAGCETGTTTFDADAVQWWRRRFGGDDDGTVPRWQVACGWMGAYVRRRHAVALDRRARGLPVPVGGPSPGVGRMVWTRDVAIGEPLRYGLQVTGKRWAGPGDWAILATHGGARDASGDPVLGFEGRLLWPTEGAGPGG